jgi:transposase
VFVSKLSYTEDQARAAVEASLSWAESLRRLGLCSTGGAWRVLKKHAANWGIATDHFLPQGRPRSADRTLDELLVEHSPVRGSNLKARLFREGLKSHECEMCGQGEDWNGARMSLILDHINGVSDDNRLENLRTVCPNCNATLETHCGRKTRKPRPAPRPCVRCGLEYSPNYPSQRYCSRACGVHHGGLRGPRPELRLVARPPAEALTALVTDNGYEAVGRLFGVSGNAIRKWFEEYDRDPPPGLHRDPTAPKRLTEHQVRRALQMLAEGLSASRVAQILNVGESRIRDLKQGRTYRHIKRPSGLEDAA